MDNNIERYKSEIKKEFNKILDIPNKDFIRILKKTKLRIDCDKCVNFKDFDYGAVYDLGCGEPKRRFWTLILMKIISNISKDWLIEIKNKSKKNIYDIHHHKDCEHSRGDL